jgi:hypothetical protein
MPIDTDKLCKVVTEDRKLAEKFLTSVYPSGTIEGDWFILGSFAGESGKSTAIRIPEMHGSDKSTGETVNGPISILLKANGLKATEAIFQLQKWLENEGVGINASGRVETEDAFPWQAAVESLSASDLSELALFCGYSIELCHRLKSVGAIAKHDGKWCFPIYDTKDAIIGVDCLVEHPFFNPGKRQKWIPKPNGADRKKSWYSLGCTGGTVKHVIITESRWDAIAIFGEYSEEELKETTILATSMGASQTEIKFSPDLESVLVCAQADEASGAGHRKSLIWCNQAANS